MARDKCVPVLPGGSCPECGWSFAKPFIDDGTVPEPHPCLPHGDPRKVKITSLCVNCGVPWNLDTVECVACHFLPESLEMQDKLREEKNTLRLKQLLAPLPPRPQVTVSDDPVNAK